MNPTTLSPVEQIGIPHSETTIGETYDCETDAERPAGV